VRSSRIFMFAGATCNVHMKHPIIRHGPAAGSTLVTVLRVLRTSRSRRPIVAKRKSFEDIAVQQAAATLSADCPAI
jgi:hypothetical protein